MSSREMKKIPSLRSEQAAQSHIKKEIATALRASQ